VDNEDVAAATLVSLALSCAQEGKQVVVADLSRGARAAHLLGVGAGIQTVTVDDHSLVAAVPDPWAVVPVGPLERTPAATLPAAGPELTAAYRAADLMFTLVTLDPSTGTEHLATWASDAVVVVTAGQSSATRIHAIGELVRRSGTQLVSAVLVGTDKSDETLGMAHASGQLALTDQNGWADR
jgi:Mrp family chromosome partitioning ATPase